MHGFTSTKYKGEKKYRYRNYCCAGRVNKLGSCHMPMLSADELEYLVLEVVMKDIIECSRKALLEEINNAIARKRGELLSAIKAQLIMLILTDLLLDLSH